MGWFYILEQTVTSVQTRAARGEFETPSHRLAHLLVAAETPRLVATKELKLLPSFNYCYSEVVRSAKTKGGRNRIDMERIY